MSNRIPCLLCGNEILPATAERTGGKCMPCHHDPGGIRAASVLATRTSTEDLLGQLEIAFTAALLEVAGTARDHLQDEGVYGFWINHANFASAQASVFTQAGLLQRIAHSQAQQVYPGKDDNFIATQLRWSLADSPYYRYHEEAFAKSDALFLALEHKKLDAETLSAWVAPLLIRSLKQVQKEAIFTSNPVFCLATGAESPVELFAWAECLCTEETLSTFQRTLPPFDSRDLDALRLRLGRPLAKPLSPTPSPPPL